MDSMISGMMKTKTFLILKGTTMKLTMACACSLGVASTHTNGCRPPNKFPLAVRDTFSRIFEMFAKADGGHGVIKRSTLEAQGAKVECPTQ